MPCFITFDPRTAMLLITTLLLKTPFDHSADVVVEPTLPLVLPLRLDPGRDPRCPFTPGGWTLPATVRAVGWLLVDFSCTMCCCSCLLPVYVPVPRCDYGGEPSSPAFLPTLVPTLPSLITGFPTLLNALYLIPRCYPVDSPLLLPITLFPVVDATLQLLRLDCRLHVVHSPH